MTTDVLQIELKTDGEGKVKASLAGVEKRLDGLDRQSGKASAGLGKVKVGLLAVAAAATAGIAYTLKTVAEFEKLNASLKTVTGSTTAAHAAMDMITETASGTPYQVSELTQAFIKLKAMGLDPSKESLISYGNTASAMGKDLNQMIEAVADAATGEFERLKEFGIKASSEGDRVKFTFKGVTTEVGKNSEEIQQYLLNIGNTEFAGAMAEQMDTLDGKFSNMMDASDRLARAIGEAGLSAAAKSLTGALTDLLNTSAQVVEIWNTPVDPLTDQKVAVRQLTEELAKWESYQSRLNEQLKQPIPDAAKNILQKEIEKAGNAIKTLRGAIADGKHVIDAANDDGTGNKPDAKAAAEKAKREKEEEQRRKEAEKARKEQQREAQRIYASTRTEMEQLAATQAKLDALYAAGAIDLDTYSRAMFDAEEATRDLGDSGEETFGRLEAAIRGWGDDFTNTMTDAVMTGKLEFSDLADSIIRDLIRIQIQKNITDQMVGAMGGFSLGSIFGFATGGIMTSSGPMPLKTYSNGGIADRPQLALYGEGSMNEAYVPLPDGRTIPVTMKGGGGIGKVDVHIHNEGGQPMEASSASATFDGEKLIVDVVTRNMSNGGQLDGLMQRQYGLRRQS